MLTKELLKFHIRQDKLVPQFVKRPFSDDITASLRQLDAVVKDAIVKNLATRRKDIEVLIHET